MIINLFKLKEISEIEFHDIVKDVIIEDINELRIILVDDSFIDVWYSLKLENRFSYHWERRHIDNLMYRHDNAPHKKWKNLSSFPKHFHDGSEDRVCQSELSEDPEKGLRNFLDFVKKKMDSLGCIPKGEPKDKERKENKLPSPPGKSFSLVHYILTFLPVPNATNLRLSGQ